MAEERKRIAIIGSGNWGSAIARIVGENAKRWPCFEPEVKMWVFEEMVDGKKLTEIINTQHENVKYLPGKKLPENVVAVPNVLDAAQDADLLVFVIPHKFVPGTCAPLKGKIKKNAFGISLIKGFGETSPGNIVLISALIKDILGIECASLMGANLANEVAEEKFCETTIGCGDQVAGQLFKSMFDTENFRVTVVPDKNTVELCGALKNIVACAAGFADGMGYGDNTKSAVIRIGLKEMVRFCKTFYGDEMQLTTFFESCGVADLITTCYGGRNRRVSEAFVKTGKPIVELEKEMLNGQKLQGFQTAEEVYHFLKAKNQIERFPLFETVHRICSQEIPPQQLIPELRREPEEF